MRWRFLILLSLVLALSAQHQDAGAAKSPSTSTLLPARTALYVEVRQPGSTLKELAGLLEHSCLDDYPAGLQRLKLQGEIDESLEFAGLLLTPEGVKEARQFQGLALAVLGPRAEGGLEYVALLQPGESAAPGLLLRRFLAGSEVQAAGEVEGVKLYRHTSFSVGGGNAQAMARMQAVALQQMRRLAQQGQIPAIPQFQSPGAVETDFALLPGLIVVGTPAAVKETVTLAKGKGDGPRLADDAGFQQASKAFGDKPGLFIHANTKGLGAEIEKLEVEKRPVWAQTLQNLFNPAALPSAGGSVTLVDGSLSIRFTATATEGAKSPFAEALPLAPFKSELLHFVPTNMETVIGLANPEGSKRWERVLEMADSLVKAADANTRLPSRQVDRLEDDLKIKFGQDVAAKITQLVVAQGATKTDGTSTPLLVVLEASDEDAAKGLVSEGLPKVLGALLGQRVVPTVKEVKGRALHVADLGSRGTYSFSRQGNVIAVGSDTELTSEALHVGENKQGLFGAARITAALKGSETAGLVLIARPATLAALLRGDPPVGRTGGLPPFAVIQGGVQAVPFAVGGLGGPRPIQPPPLPQPPGQPAGRVADPAGDRKSDEGSTPLVLGVRRQADQIIIEGRLLEPKVGLAKLVDKLIEAGTAAPAVPAGPGFLQGQLRIGPGPGPGGLPPAKAVPLPGQAPPPPIK